MGNFIKYKQNPNSNYFLLKINTQKKIALKILRLLPIIKFTTNYLIFIQATISFIKLAETLENDMYCAPVPFSTC